MVLHPWEHPEKPSEGHTGRLVGYLKLFPSLYGTNVGHRDDPTDQETAVGHGDVEPFGYVVLVSPATQDGMEHVRLLALSPEPYVLLEELLQEHGTDQGGVAGVRCRVHGSPCSGPGISFAGSVPGLGRVACLSSSLAKKPLVSLPSSFGTFFAPQLGALEGLFLSFSSRNIGSDLSYRPPMSGGGCGLFTPDKVREVQDAIGVGAKPTSPSTALDKLDQAEDLEGA